MTFERPLALLLLILPLLWAGHEWRKTPRKTALVLKALALIAIAVALAAPRLAISETKVALALLVDTSASVTEQDLARASALATEIERSRGRNWVRVIPFARETRNAAAAEHPNAWALRYTASEAGRGTDLEAGVREAIASLPEGYVPRILVVTDGKENRGSIARAAYQARQLGIPIDTVALSGRPQPNLRIEAVAIPSLTFTGEQFPIDLLVSSPRTEKGEIEIQAEGKTIGKSQVAIVPGENRIRAHATLTASGAVDVAVSLRAKALGELRFDQAVTLRRPKLLYVSQDPPNTESNFLEALQAAQFDVQRATELPQTKAGAKDLVVLNNIDIEKIPAARKQDLENFVKQGGGLLIIGGEKNVYPERKKTEDALDRALPAKIAPPRSPEGTCVVLIIDKSSSMEGRKIELARLAAVGVIDNLRPIDTVGVLIFDNSFQWAVPLRRAEDKTLIKRLVSGITPDGGTQIAPALTEAFRKIAAAQGTFKHIVLLTDGISEEGDSIEIAREAANRRITISTVGLGQDVNRSYLEKVAGTAAGRSYFLSDPSGLAQILLRDVMEHTGSTAVEKSLHVAVAKNAEILDGVGIESAPALKGYIRYLAKPSAETILTIDRKDPLLARWQYGLGRAAVFTSDAKSRWAADWIGWQGYDKFWTNLVRDLLPHTDTGEATVDYDAVNGDLRVNYRLSAEADESAAIPEIYAFGPAGFQRTVEITKVAQGWYQGRVHIGENRGLYRIRPLAESSAFPEVGLYRQEDEFNDFGADRFLLRQVAEFTGGRTDPRSAEVFDSGNRYVAATLRLWPGLLALALALNIAEVVLRKWRGLFKR